MAPAQRLDDRTGFAVGKIEPVVTVERIGLQNAGVTGQIPLGMLPCSIARGVEQRRWWPPLKEASVARKATGDSPLLETGELRNSIEKTIGHHVAWVGSDDDKAVWMEFGTSTIPPRSFIASAGMVCEQQIHTMAVETIGATLAGHSAASAIYHAAKEAAHVWAELGRDLMHDSEGNER